MSRWVSVFLRDVPAPYRSLRKYLKLYLFAQNYRLVLNYRIGRELVSTGSQLRFFVPVLKRAQFRKWACDISYNAEIGSGLRLAHPIGIVIGERVRIGQDVTIFQNVTLGSHGRAGGKDYPIIEDNVTIYAGAKIIGGITIGKGAIIGANAVVTRNVRENSSVVGVPAREIST